jgi:hypothetical protein
MNPLGKIGEAPDIYGPLDLIGPELLQLRKRYCNMDVRCILTKSALEARQFMLIRLGAALLSLYP